MKKFVSTLKKVLIVVLIVFLGFVIHIMVSTGYFRKISNQFDGAILKEIALPGAEDITVCRTGKFALISSTDRSTFPADKNVRGNLFLMDLTDPDYNLKNLTTNYEEPFAPHGISLFKKDSVYTIAAISHTAAGHAVEIFQMLGDSLVHKNTLRHPSMVSPNDLVLLDENRFYFTNDHKHTRGIGRLLEDYAGLSESNVVYFDGNDFREVAGGIAYANGINFDPGRRLLFVSSSRKFLIKVYESNVDGTLQFIEDIPCDTGPDNIEFDPQGNLWIGAHPNLLRFAAYAKNKKLTSPSEVIKVQYRKKGDYTVNSVFLDDGSTLSASSVAAPYEDLILIGNVKDNKFLILKKN